VQLCIQGLGDAACSSAGVLILVLHHHHHHHHHHHDHQITKLSHSSSHRQHNYSNAAATKKPTALDHRRPMCLSFNFSRREAAAGALSAAERCSRLTSSLQHDAASVAARTL
jgi:hypothetical protein